MTPCAACHRLIQATAKDPVIAATSLGAGYYHHACAVAVWRERATRHEQHREEARARRSKAAKARWAARSQP